MSTDYFVDLVGGNDSNNCTTYALRGLTVAHVLAGHTLTAGDRIKVAKTPDPVSLGINATWTSKSITLTLASSLTLAIYSDGAWTASTNVTCTTDTTNKKEGANASSIAVAGAFTTGLAAFFATGTLDLSPYQNFSFWIRPSAAVAANALRVDLCSDTAGTTPVNSFTINRALNSGQYTALTFRNGSALGSSIKSVALTVLTDLGASAVTILIDNIFGCNNLCLDTAVGKNDGTWWTVKSVVGTTVVLDRDTNAMQGTGQGFYGVSETVPIYSVQMFRTAAVASNQADVINLQTQSGSSSAQNVISGGWDTSGSMTTQNGNTFLDGADGFGICIHANTYWTVDHIFSSRHYYGVKSEGTGTVHQNGGVLSSTNFAFISGITTNFQGLSSIVWTACGAGGASSNLGGSTGTSAAFSTYTNLTQYSGGAIGTFSNCIATNIVSSNCASAAALSWGAECTMINVTTNDNVRGVDNTNAATGNTFIYNLTSINNQICFMPETTGTTQEIYGLTTNGSSEDILIGASGSRNNILIKNWTHSGATPTLFQNETCRIYSEREGGVLGTDVIYDYLGTITKQQSVTAEGSGSAWKFSPNANCNVNYPLSLSIGAFVCLANKTTTITYKAARTNSSMVGTLRVFGGRFTGVGSAGSDLTTNVNPTANASPGTSDFAIYSIAVTPTEDQVVEVFFETYGSSSNSFYIDTCGQSST